MNLTEMIVMGGAAVAISSGVYLAVLQKGEAKGIQSVASASNKFAEKADAKVKAVQKRAAVPGAAKRLLTEACRDCSEAGPPDVRSMAAPVDKPK